MSLAKRVRLPRLPWLLLLPAAVVLAGCGSPAQTGPASWPSVSTDGTTAYVASGPQVFAVDIETGRMAWPSGYPAEPSRDVSFYAAPAIADDGVIYIGGYDKSVYAVDAATGEQISVVAANLDGRVIGSPVVAGDLLLIPTDGGSVYAVDRHSGEPKWPAPFTAETEDCGTGERTPTCAIWSAPLVDGDTVYVANLAHVLYALDLESGEQRWQSPLGAAIADTPALQDGVLLTGVLGNSLVGVRAQDGEPLWTAPTAGWLWGSPAVAGETAYFGDVTPTFWTTKDGEGNVYAFDLTNQEVVWQKSTSATSTSPALAGDRLIVAFENGQLVAYDLAGEELWRKAALGPIRADPVVSAGKVIVAVTSSEALLQAFDIDSGDPAWPPFLPPASG